MFLRPNLCGPQDDGVRFRRSLLVLNFRRQPKQVIKETKHGVGTGGVGWGGSVGVRSIMNN